MQEAVKMIAMLLVGVVLGASATGWYMSSSSSPHGAPVPPGTALDRLHQLGAEVVQDERNPARPVVSIDLSKTRTPITDKELTLVRGFSELEELCLDGSAVSDDGLGQLTELPRLRDLALRDTGVTDVGLAHLKALPKLRTLALSRAKITDAGLVHLRHMPSLKTVSLFGNHLSEVAIQELQTAMPDLKVER